MMPFALPVFGFPPSREPFHVSHSCSSCFRLQRPGRLYPVVYAAARLVAAAIDESLRSLEAMPGEELAEDRYSRFRRIGSFLA